MSSDTAKRIEAWFAEHDDGEFSQAVPSQPYSHVAPPSDMGRIIYTTKPRLVSALAKFPGSCCMMGQYGLPSQSDAEWLRETVKTRGLLFLGDCDPVDLLIFAWLRTHRFAGEMKYLGLGDAVLDALAIPSIEMFLIPLSQSEQRALPMLNDVLPDFREQIGPGCSRFLEEGYKIELEALISFREKARLVLEHASRSDT